MIPLVPASFGDIVAAGNLALAIYKALSDSTGSSYEYQCLVDELHSFERALRTVELAIAISPPSGRLAQDIREETTTCLNLLKTFFDRIQSYQKDLGTGSKGASWRKIGWGLFKADEVRNFRQKLSQHKLNIILFLSGLQMYVPVTSMSATLIRLSDISVLSASYADETRQSSGSIKEGILALQKRLPPSVKHGDENTVTLINAFGERLPLFWECCFSQDVRHRIITDFWILTGVNRDFMRHLRHTSKGNAAKSLSSVATTAFQLTTESL